MATRVGVYRLLGLRRITYPLRGLQRITYRVLDLVDAVRQLVDALARVVRVHGLVLRERTAGRVQPTKYKYVQRYEWDRDTLPVRFMRAVRERTAVEVQPLGYTYPQRYEWDCETARL
jgi:hypothetical protein